MEPMTWVKAKYTAPKTRGRYSGGANAAPQKKRHKVGSRSAVKPTHRNTLVLGTNGKFRWEMLPI